MGSGHQAWSAAPRAVARIRFEGSTKSTLGHPEMSKDGVPQLADVHLGVCSLLTKEAATQKLHVKLLPQN